MLLYHWLAEALYWQGKAEERVRVGEEGLSLLGDDDESLEAALMNQAIAIGYEAQGECDRYVEHTLRTARFLRRLPYTRELQPPYTHTVMALRESKEIQAATGWLRALEERAIASHDLGARFVQMARVDGKRMDVAALA